MMIHGSGPYESTSTSAGHPPILHSAIGLGKIGCEVSSPAAGGDVLVGGSPTPGADGLQSFLVSPFVEPFDVVAAAQEAIPGL